MFEVLLISPEGTVIGTINRAQVTIRDSGKNKSQLCIFKIPGLFARLHHCTLAIFTWPPNKENHYKLR